MAAVALTVYQGLAGDHNGRALVGARALGARLEARLGVTATVVSEPAPVLDTHWDVELASALGELRLLAATIDTALAQGARPVSALTRCATAMATLPVVARHHPDVCVVWFDAHTDLNTPLTTPTGYLGGMALAGAAGLWNTQLGSGPTISQVILVGTREVDPTEQAVIDAHHIPIVSVDGDVATALVHAIAGRPVYVHLDCDVLDPDIVPTDYAADRGMTISELRAACAAIAQGTVVGLEVAELEGAWHDGGSLVPPDPILEAIEPLLARLAG
ncbi:Arginase [Luteitalea pratensis]|uniref:Arginase n=1 Tax=Luteitalea pratensis TaxID=1855912 RepID=A0A143PEI8_LUTPR|nr:arginase family protein [Luteitalea pratensis]AMY06856.1 Arginase [Luteitalea pratensis]